MVACRTDWSGLRLVPPPPPIASHHMGLITYVLILPASYSTNFNGSTPPRRAPSRLPYHILLFIVVQLVIFLVFFFFSYLKKKKKIPIDNLRDFLFFFFKHFFSNVDAFLYVYHITVLLVLRKRGS